MPVYTNINGVWRELWSSHTMINGVWRDSDVNININNVWRSAYKYSIVEQDITGFYLIYQFMSEMSHPFQPHLTVNPNLPYSISTTGENQGWNSEPMGIIYQWDYDGLSAVEGIAMYKGTLYAMLTSGVAVNVTSVKEDSSPDNRYIVKSLNIQEAWNSDRIDMLSIVIEGYKSTWVDGFMSGWNGMFDNQDIVNEFDPVRKNEFDPGKIILPKNSRDPNYKGISTIGIAKNTSTQKYNMLRSYGSIDHKINSIKVNGVLKPFTIEIVK